MTLGSFVCVFAQIFEVLEGPKKDEPSGLDRVKVHSFVLIESA